jgi:uncharacterized SAM-binding protein YcdF (DUF218 family)
MISSKNFYDFLTIFLLPPGLGITLLLVAGLGVFFVSDRSRWFRSVRVFFLSALMISYALTTPMVGYQMAAVLEGQLLQALPLGTLHEMQGKGEGPGAIVILGGGLKYDEREKPYPLTINQRTAVRLQYGAYLAKNSMLPVLVSGGIGGSFDASEATAMARTFIEDYGVEAKWQEGISLTTAENALFSAAILKRHGIKKIVLVTHAYHMRRSVLAFEAQGLEVVMAPCGFMSGNGVDKALAWLPTLGGIEIVFATSHEIVGLLYYRLRGYIPRLSYQP